MNPVLEAVKSGRVTPAAMLKAIRTGANNANAPASKVLVQTSQVGASRLAPYDGDWMVKGGRYPRNAEGHNTVFGLVNHAETVLARYVRVFGC